MGQRQISAINLIIVGAAIVVALSVSAVSFAPSPAQAIFLDNLHWTVSAVAAACVAWLGYRSQPAAAVSAANRGARFWFACGLTSYAVGQIIWDLQVFTGWNPFPGPADLFYVAIGPCCALGFITALWRHTQSGDPRTAQPQTRQSRSSERWAFGLDAAALSIGVLAITFALYLPANEQVRALPLAVMVAYPVGLLSGVCCGLVLVLVIRPRAEWPWIMMLGALATMGFIWMLWNALMLNNAVGSGKGLNALASLASLLAGYAAAHWRLRPSPSLRYSRIVETLRYLLPMVLVVLACVAIILVTAWAPFPAPARLLIGGASALVAILAIVRQTFLLKERDDLLRAEGHARQRIARFDQMAATIEDAIFVSRFDGTHFIYEELNLAALALLRRRAEDAIGHHVQDVLPPGAAEQALVHYRRGIVTGEPLRYQIRFDTPDGPQWYDTLLLPTRNPDGSVTHLHGVSRNMTALKLQTEKLERLALDLDRARREAESANRAKSMFLAKMSHELRTPLNAILGFTELMDRQVFGPIGSERYEGYLKDIYSSGHMLLLLVNDVLDLSKLESGQYQLREESVDLGEIAAETCAMLEQQAQSKGITLANIRRPLPRVMADRRAIGQILVNLVANGLKFTPNSGSVEIITDRGADGAPQLRVRDTGMGIPPHEIHAVREAFVQGAGAMRSAEAGTGLGLAIVCSMAELHGGAVTIDSEEGRGTTVTVSLPASRMLAA